MKLSPRQGMIDDMKKESIVSIVIGSYNRLTYLQATIDTLRAEIKNLSAEIIIVDGGSTDGTMEWLVEQKDIITILQHNRGEWLGKKLKRRSWGYFMNLGFKVAQGKYICMISDDCLVVPGAIRNGVKQFDKELKADDKVGAMAFYWRNWPEQKDYWVGLAWGGRLFVNHGLYLREAMEKVGFVDEDSFFFYHADGDLSLRIWDAGYSIVDSPDSFIEHFSDANTEVRATNMEQQQKDWNTYTARWGYLKMPDKDWVEKPFKDPKKTADRYWGNKKTFIERMLKK